jgi:hypothetical protein
MPRPTTHGLRQLERRWRDQSLDAATVKILRDLVADIADDAGGPANMSIRQLWVAEGAAFAKFVIGQGMDFIVKRGSVFDDSGSFHPVLGKYLLAWMNVLRLNLVELGLNPDRADTDPPIEREPVQPHRIEASPAPVVSAGATEAAVDSPIPSAPPSIVEPQI